MADLLNNMLGGMQQGMQNPMFGMGVGILAGNGLGQGLQQGWKNMQVMRELQQRQDQATSMLNMRTQEMRQKRYESEKKAREQQATANYYGTPVGVTPSGTAQNMRAAGYMPGTPQAQQAMQKYLEKPQTQINMGPGKAPAGYYYPDPSNPQAGMERIPGGKFTDVQTTSAGYADRMEQADNLLTSIEHDPSSMANVVQSKMPNVLRSEGYQQYEQAQRDWVRAKLRKESGAVIADEEMEKEVETYFPQPGDGPQVVKQKEEARRRANEAMKQSSGDAYDELYKSKQPEIQPPPGFTVPLP